MSYGKVNDHPSGLPALEPPLEMMLYYKGYISHHLPAFLSLYSDDEDPELWLGIWLILRLFVISVPQFDYIRLEQSFHQLRMHTGARD